MWASASSETCVGRKEKTRMKKKQRKRGGGGYRQRDATVVVVAKCCGIHWSSRLRAGEEKEYVSREAAVLIPPRERDRCARSPLHLHAALAALPSHALSDTSANTPDHPAGRPSRVIPGLASPQFPIHSTCNPICSASLNRTPVHTATGCTLLTDVQRRTTSCIAFNPKLTKSVRILWARPRSSSTDARAAPARPPPPPPSSRPYRPRHAALATR